MSVEPDFILCADAVPVHLSYHNVKGSVRSISAGQTVRIAVSVLHGNHVFVQLADEEAGVAPAKIAVFHALVVFLDPDGRVNVFPCMYAVIGIGISYQRMSDILKRSGGTVGYRHADGFAAAVGADRLCAVIEIIFSVAALCHLSGPRRHVVLCPGDMRAVRP